MDDLLQEFLTETNESIEVVDVELVRFEQDPNNAQILGNIFRLVHTIKGTCGFLGLPRLEGIAHAAETLMGKFRDGAPVQDGAVTTILNSIDRIKTILVSLGNTGGESEGDDSDLIDQLNAFSDAAFGAPTAAEPEKDDKVLVVQELARELRPGEVSLDDLERAFRETAVDDSILQTINAQPIAEPAKAPAPTPKAKKPDVNAVTVATEEGEGGMKNQSIRVNVETLENLMTMVSELVLTRNQLLEIARKNEENDFKVPLQRLSNVTAELQEGVMKTRMQPIGNAWQKLPRIVRDLGQELKKTIELDMRGAETELDRQVLELIKDPLTHMVRNSADHGLELPADRVKAGKKETGTIRLSAFHEGGHIIIEIADDGRGLNTDRIKQKIVENGLATEAELEKLTEAQINKFIFAPGFSTAAAVTSVSGRGVGMDVVKTNIDAIGGTVDLRSVPGQGSTFTIKIPLTLAIVSALIVESAGQRYAIPQLAVVELVRARGNANSEHRIEMLKNTPVLRLRNKLLPLLNLREMLNCDCGTKDADTTRADFIVVTKVGQQVFGIVVDNVFHTEEIVVKPMSSALRSINMFSGNTILGDGSVILIIDPNNLSQNVSGVAGAATDQEKDDDHGNMQGEKISFLVFQAGSDDPKAVPLSLITRLEEVDVARIEKGNDRELVQYRGSLMPLIYVNDQVKHKTEGTQALLVFSDTGRSMGLAVDSIVDIVEDNLHIEVPSDKPGYLGTAVIKGKATEVIDVTHFMQEAFEDWLSRKEDSINHRSRNLLFVDDSAFFRNMFPPILKSAGYNVKVCDSAIHALEVLRKGYKADIIVSDIEMPEMSGFEFAQAVHADSKISNIPIIALSSLMTPDSISKGRDVGFYDYVAKFDRQGLLASLKEASNSMEIAA